MTLDEAITHAREVAQDKRREATYNFPSLGDYYDKCEQCAKEHEQLAEWLEDYKRLKSIPEHTYENCHNITCRRKCEKDGYNKAIDDCKSVIDNAYIQEYIDGFTYAIITENYEQLKEGTVMIDNEVPKHHKKKPSSISKSSTKSKHKHEYVECLLIHNKHPHRATYCKICGKIGDLHLFETEPYKDGMRRALDYDEVYEKYKDLEKIEIENIFQRYVPD